MTKLLKVKDTTKKKSVEERESQNRDEETILDNSRGELQEELINHGKRDAEASSDCIGGNAIWVRIEYVKKEIKERTAFMQDDGHTDVDRNSIHQK